jgi:transcriptional regulator with XRE-family HTH domain
MPPELLDELLDRVRNAAALRGARADLAEKLGVTPSAVSRYLADKSKPSGEVTLRMQQWVAAHEDKQKDAGRVAPRPARKAQAKKHANESRNSGQPPS